MLLNPILIKNGNTKATWTYLLANDILKRNRIKWYLLVGEKLIRYENFISVILLYIIHYR